MGANSTPQLSTRSLQLPAVPTTSAATERLQEKRLGIQGIKQNITKSCPKQHEGPEQAEHHNVLATITKTATDFNKPPSKED